MAYVGWIDGKLGVDKEKGPVFESDLVKELRSLGAVFYCKTALPQTVLVGFPYGQLNGRSQGLTFISLLAWRNNQQHHWRDEESKKHSLVVWGLVWWGGCPAGTSSESSRIWHGYR